MFERRVPVRWRDTDAQGHVNHAVFLTYLEEGRDAFYAQAIGAEPSYVVVRIEVDLRAEVRHPDQQVTVRIQAERLGTTSLTTQETILTPSGEVAAEARVVTVRWDPGHRQPIPFGQAERTRLAEATAGLPPGRPSWRDHRGCMLIRCGRFIAADDHPGGFGGLLLRRLLRPALARAAWMVISGDEAAAPD